MTDSPFGPPPHYLLGDSVTVKEVCQKISAKGTLVFPSSDPSLAPRGRANTSHQLMGVWNLYHHIAGLKLIPSGALVRSQSSIHTAVISLDEPYEVECEIDPMSHQGTWKIRGGSREFASGKVRFALLS